MQVILEVKDGPLAGRRLVLGPGQGVTIGRTERADFAVQDDDFMSSLHFAVECGPQSCRVIDRRSSNGTFLNGVRVTEAMVRDGDEIRAGQTTFVVRILESKEAELPEAPSASPGAVLPEAGASVSAGNLGLQIGGWSLSVVPSGWELVEQQGIRRAGKNVFPSNVVVTEEQLPQDKTLQHYVESQVFLMQQVIPQVKLGAAGSATIRGAEEAFALEIRFPSDNGRPVVQRQVYARAGRSVGILTFTTLQEELPTIRHVFDSILAGVTFHPKE